MNLFEFGWAFNNKSPKGDYIPEEGRKKLSESLGKLGTISPRTNPQTDFAPGTTNNPSVVVYPQVLESGVVTPRIDGSDENLIGDVHDPYPNRTWGVHASPEGSFGFTVSQEWLGQAYVDQIRPLLPLLPEKWDKPIAMVGALLNLEGSGTLEEGIELLREIQAYHPDGCRSHSLETLIVESLQRGGSPAWDVRTRGQYQEVQRASVAGQRFPSTTALTRTTAYHLVPERLRARAQATIDRGGFLCLPHWFGTNVWCTNGNIGGGCVGDQVYFMPLLDGSIRKLLGGFHGLGCREGYGPPWLWGSVPWAEDMIDLCIEVMDRSEARNDHDGAVALQAVRDLGKFWYFPPSDSRGWAEGTYSQDGTAYHLTGEALDLRGQVGSPGHRIPSVSTPPPEVDDPEDETAAPACGMCPQCLQESGEITDEEYRRRMNLGTDHTCIYWDE